MDDFYPILTGWEKTMFILGITDAENEKITALKDGAFIKDSTLLEQDCDTKIRIIVTGPKKSGKSALIERFRIDNFNEKMIPYGDEDNKKFANSA